MSRRADLAAIRAQITAIEAGTRAAVRVWPFGEPAVDVCLPHGGLALGVWHEIGAEGMEAEICAAPAAFAAKLAGALSARGGELVWVMRRDDLHPPGLAGLGLCAERLIQVKADSEDEALAVLEEALSTPGVAAAVAEAEEVPLIAGRRLQLACERGGGTGLVLRRRPWGAAARRGAKDAGSAAASRWKIAPAPGQAGAGGAGLFAPRWAVALERCRGGRPGAWILEGSQDGPHPFRLAAEVADHGLAPALRRTA